MPLALGELLALCPPPLVVGGAPLGVPSLPPLTLPISERDGELQDVADVVAGGERLALGGEEGRVEAVAALELDRGADGVGELLAALGVSEPLLQLLQVGKPPVALGSAVAREETEGQPEDEGLLEVEPQLVPGTVALADAEMVERGEAEKGAEWVSKGVALSVGGAEGVGNDVSVGP